MKSSLLKKLRALVTRRRRALTGFFFFRAHGRRIPPGTTGFPLGVLVHIFGVFFLECATLPHQPTPLPLFFTRGDVSRPFVLLTGGSAR
jgi:hypothetical protein